MTRRALSVYRSNIAVLYRHQVATRAKARDYTRVARRCASLEVNARVENETPHSAVAARVDAAGQTVDCAEIGGFDVCDRGRKVRMIQYIDHVDPELKLLAFMTSESFDHV